MASLMVTPYCAGTLAPSFDLANGEGAARADHLRDGLGLIRLWRSKSRLPGDARSPCRGRRSQVRKRTRPCRERSSSPSARKDEYIMATPLSRRPEPGGDFPQTVPAQSASDEYALPATRRAIAAQAAAALGILTGLWVAISPLFIVLQHGGGLNAAGADVIA